MAKQKKKIEKWERLADPFWGKLYEVSNQGRVREKEKTNKKFFRNKEYEGKVLPFMYNDAHTLMFVILQHRTDDGEYLNKAAFVTNEVALAFIPKPREDEFNFRFVIVDKVYIKKSFDYVIVENIDGDYKNNNVSNIRWITEYDQYIKEKEQ
jgi:hypothetical protein